jgi:hypothetical protein
MKSRPAARHKFQATPAFWSAFWKLPAAQRVCAREAWKLFQENPFHPLLGTHRIASLSARYKTTVYSAVLAGDLRVAFIMDGHTIVSIDIGKHKIYR